MSYFRLPDRTVHTWHSKTPGEPDVLFIDDDLGQRVVLDSANSTPSRVITDETWELINAARAHITPPPDTPAPPEQPEQPSPFSRPQN